MKAVEIYTDMVSLPSLFVEAFLLSVCQHQLCQIWRLMFWSFLHYSGQEDLRLAYINCYRHGGGLDRTIQTPLS